MGQVIGRVWGGLIGGGLMSGGLMSGGLEGIKGLGGWWFGVLEREWFRGIER